MGAANGKAGGESERKQRLAEALRANLKRRKASDRRRAAATDESQSEPAGTDESKD